MWSHDSVRLVWLLEVHGSCGRLGAFVQTSLHAQRFICLWAILQSCFTSMSCRRAWQTCSSRPFLTNTEALMTVTFLTETVSSRLLECVHVDLWSECLRTDDLLKSPFLQKSSWDSLRVSSAAALRNQIVFIIYMLVSLWTSMKCFCHICTFSLIGKQNKNINDSSWVHVDLFQNSCFF